MYRIDYRARLVAGLLALAFCLVAFSSTHVSAHDDPCVTPDPTEMPTEEPTEFPTEEPTAAPTEVPTEEPTEVPTEQPSGRDWGSRLAFLQSDDPCATETPDPCVPQAMTEVPATEEPTAASATEAPTEEPTLDKVNASTQAFLQTSDDCVTPTAPEPEPTRVTVTVLPETGEGQSAQQPFGVIAMLLAGASLVAAGGYLWLRRSGDNAG